MSLVLPLTAWLIAIEINPEQPVQVENGVIEHLDLHHAVAEGREKLHDDFKKRWTEDLSESVLEDYIVSTLLDPRWKNWDFEGCGMFLDGTMTRDKALSYLRTQWKNDWKPAATACQPAPTKVVATSNFGESFFMRKRSEVVGVSAPPVVKDQLDEYLALPQEPNNDWFDVMVWWNNKAAAFPVVYQMARQFLGCPATTGGVERTFSAAGRMHDDLRKNTGEDTLEHMLRVKMSVE